MFFNNARLFWVPGRLEPVDLMMIWLVIVWLVFFDFPLPARRRAVQGSRVFGPALSSPEEFVLIGIAALAALELPLTVLRFGAIGPALGEAKGFIYLFVGYFLLRGMFSRASRRDTIDLVTALVVVNTIAAGLFVLHQGLHLPIYEGVTEYQTLVFGGQVITRSFYFMPQLIALAWHSASPSRSGGSSGWRCSFSIWLHYGYRILERWSSSPRWSLWSYWACGC